jgi:hypothetical protein
VCNIGWVSLTRYLDISTAGWSHVWIKVSWSLRRKS